MSEMKNGCVRAFVFDLDGTLVDSKMDLVNSVNAMLRETGRAEQPAELVASYVGHGAPRLIASVLGTEADDQQKREALAIFLKHYGEQKLNLTRPYAGVMEGLRELAAYPMAVLTNKPTQLSEEILQGLGMVAFFQVIHGGDSFETKKPDPSGALTIVKEMGVTPSEAAMVGDSDVDIQTARNAGMVAVAVTYGFGQQNAEAFTADIYVNTLTELTALAKKASPLSR